MDETMTEDQAIDMVIELERRFGWSATIITRRDVEYTVNRPLADDEWAKLTGSRQWSRHVADALLAPSIQAVRQAVEDVLPEDDD